MPLYNDPIFSVSEITEAVRDVIESGFRHVAVRGEISNFRPAASGHLYFSLKDAGALLSAAAFSAARRPWRAHLVEGQEVICIGRLSLYAPRGSYQLIVENVEPLGKGALQIQFEKLKAKLLKEGLFESNLKRPLPSLPKRVAVVTSPTGAAVHDFIAVLRKRAPQVQVTVVPAVVQGEGAPASLRTALQRADELSLGEVIVLTRGGGSFEDLFAFSDEALARAIRETSVPVISAVGHEVDFSISDFVADVRAPTPTAAAEILTVQWVRQSDQVKHLLFQLRTSMFHILGAHSRKLSLLQARLRSPLDRLREQAQRLDELDRRMQRVIQNILFHAQQRIENRAAKLDALSPLKVLSRGYAMVLDTHSQVISSAQKLEPGDRVDLRFSDGSCSATITDPVDDNSLPSGAPPASR